jgi:hypothetical protein
MPCHIIQSINNFAVPIFSGESIVEVTSTEGHLPQLSAPDILVPVLLKHIRYCIANLKM